jgi:integration host factor subunit alpha
MTLTKAELSESLAQQVNIQKGEAKELVDYVFEEIRRALQNGDEVKISGFGNFELKDKRKRPGRNPKTGEEVDIAARRVVTFKPGQKLKDRVEHFGSPNLKASEDEKVV